MRFIIGFILGLVFVGFAYAGSYDYHYELVEINSTLKQIVLELRRLK